MMYRIITRLSQSLVILAMPCALMGALTKYRSLTFKPLQPTYAGPKTTAGDILDIITDGDLRALETLSKQDLPSIIENTKILGSLDPQYVVELLETIPSLPMVSTSDYENPATSSAHKQLYLRQTMRAAIYEQAARKYQEMLAQHLAVSVSDLPKTIHQQCGGSIQRSTLYDSTGTVTQEYFGVPRATLGTLAALEQWLWLAQAFQAQIPALEIWERQARNYRWSRDNEQPNGSWTSNINQDIIEWTVNNFVNIHLGPGARTISREELQAASCRSTAFPYLSLQDVRYIPRIIIQTGERLAILSVSNIRPSALETLLRAAPFLQQLTIGSSKIQAKIWTAITDLKNLERLTIQSADITSIPAKIKNMSNLTELDLRFNTITQVPPQIGDLSHLEHLNLQHNAVTSLPVEIGKLKNLQTLDLSNNQLTDLPNTILDLTSLATLELSNNKFTRIPAVFFKPSSHLISSINLSGNPISSNTSSAGPYEVLRGPSPGRINLFKRYYLDDTALRASKE